jgi:mono/diheme cytochrome c family protein
MKNPFRLFLTNAALLTTALSAQTSDRTELIARGRYLVDNVVGCADCHSPRNERGEFIKEKWLMGSPLAFALTVPMPARPSPI